MKQLLRTASACVVLMGSWVELGFSQNALNTERVIAPGCSPANERVLVTERVTGEGHRRVVLSNDSDRWMIVFFHSWHAGALFELPPGGQHVSVVYSDHNRAWSAAAAFIDDLGSILVEGEPRLNNQVFDLPRLQRFCRYAFLIMAEQSRYDACRATGRRDCEAPQYEWLEEETRIEGRNP